MMKMEMKKIGCINLRKHNGFHDLSRDIMTDLMKGDMANLMI
jgi:hypothetical protein